MKFVNREEELNILQKLYGDDRFQFIPIYARRRIGKTRLIQEFIKNKPAIYFLADSLSEAEQLKNLGKECGDYFKDSRRFIPLSGIDMPNLRDGAEVIDRRYATGQIHNLPPEPSH